MSERESDNLDVEMPMWPTAEDWEEFDQQVAEADRQSQLALLRREAADEFLGAPDHEGRLDG